MLRTSLVKQLKLSPPFPRRGGSGPPSNTISLGHPHPPKSLHSKQDLDPLSRVCTAKSRDRQTPQSDNAARHGTARRQLEVTESSVEDAE